MTADPSRGGRPALDPEQATVRRSVTITESDLARAEEIARRLGAEHGGRPAISVAVRHALRVVAMPRKRRDR